MVPQNFPGRKKLIIGIVWETRKCDGENRSAGDASPESDLIYGNYKLLLEICGQRVDTQPQVN